MKTTYAVVWKEGAGATVAGRLQVGPRAVILHGGSNAETVERVIPLESLTGIHVGRSSEDRLDTRPTVVLDRRGSDPIRIASVVQPGIVSELAERLVRLQVLRERAVER